MVLLAVRSGTALLLRSDALSTQNRYFGPWFTQGAHLFFAKPYDHSATPVCFSGATDCLGI
jgi:hypothetical protein